MSEGAGRGCRYFYAWSEDFVRFYFMFVGYEGSDGMSDGVG